MMDIGSKLKSARLSSGVTQEEAAAALGVSRQTVSNWENGRTYPDIVSVVKMSDLYKVSLDGLLKEGPSAPEYLDYLQEATEAEKKRQRLTAAVLAGVYAGLWLLSMAVFCVFVSAPDALGYGVMFLLFLLPSAVFAVSVVMGRAGIFGPRKWFLAAAFGAMYMLAEYIVFGLSNMAAYGRLDPPAVWLFASGAAVSALGLGIGTAVDRLRRRGNKDE